MKKQSELDKYIESKGQYSETDDSEISFGDVFSAIFTLKHESVGAYGSDDTILSAMLAEEVLTTPQDREEFMRRISRFSVEDKRVDEKVLDTIKIIRSQKQKDLKITYEELQFAVAYHDIELLKKIFMTNVIYEHHFDNIDKSKFAERYFEAVKPDGKYVDFLDLIEAK